MKINRIDFINTTKAVKHEKNAQNPIKETNLNNNNITQFSNNYNSSIFFTSKKTLKEIQNYRAVSSAFTPETKEILNLAKGIALKSNSDEVESWHIYYANLLKLKRYINELDEGIIKYDSDLRYKTPQGFETAVYSGGTTTFFDKKEKREKVKKVVEQHIKEMNKNFVQPSKNNPKKSHPFGISLSKGAMNDIVEIYNLLSGQVADGGMFNDSFFSASALMSSDRRLVKEATKFLFDMEKALMVEKIDNRNKNHLAFYDDKADVLWKNINIGKNVIVTCDLKNYDQLKHLKNSFVNLINKPGQEYKNIDPEKTNVITLNNDTTLTFFTDLIRKAREEKDKKTVIFADFISILANSGATLLPADVEILANPATKENDNVKVIFTMTPETYYANTSDGASLNNALSGYSVQTLSALNTRDAYIHLAGENGVEFIKKLTGKTFSTSAIKKAIVLTLNKDGNYPDKAINLLNSVALFNSKSDEITPKMIEDYVLATKDLSETSTRSTEGNVVFNTGLKISDIVGSPMTKADAENLALRIKNGTFKTEGCIIQQSNGSSYGGGRKHTAYAIAGEAGIPVVMMDAKEFMLKDIDTLSQKADLSEMKIKKIFATAKSQAETNPNNTAMIFVENFDNFASSPLYGISSIYEQKAFSQLLGEMEKLRKNDGVKVLVMGSVNMPALIDKNIMKPGKFLNSIVVYAPQTEKEVKEVFDYHIKKMNLKIAGDTKEQRDKIVREISQTTLGFSVSDIMYLLETANNVMIERKKSRIDLSDFIEAFLQVTTGRSAGCELNKYGKNIVTSHEAGHALTLQIMNEFAQKNGENWHLPDKVNFITLDPRGYYGGAMFHKASENRQTSYEKIMSDLVCSYGGHSAEKIIYGMYGSWGITADMEHVNALANAAVLDMGMGSRIGVRHIERDALGQPNVSEAKKALIEQDVDDFLSAAMKISDSIVATYKEFIEEFTRKHSKDVGSGNCIISSQEFIQELNDWREKQPPEKQGEFEKLEVNILSALRNVQNKNNK